MTTKSDIANTVSDCGNVIKTHFSLTLWYKIYTFSAPSNIEKVKIGTKQLEGYVHDILKFELLTLGFRGIMSITILKFKKLVKKLTSVDNLTHLPYAEGLESWYQ